MPDEDGKLSQDEFKRVQKYLAEKETKAECPSCGKGVWSVQTHIAMLPSTLRFGKAQIAYPSVILICQTCAFMRFHSAVVMGLMKKEAPVETPKAEVSNG